MSRATREGNRNTDAQYISKAEMPFLVISNHCMYFSGQDVVFADNVTLWCSHPNRLALADDPVGSAGADRSTSVLESIAVFNSLPELTQLGSLNTLPLRLVYFSAPVGSDENRSLLKAASTCKLNLRTSYVSQNKK